MQDDLAHRNLSKVLMYRCPNVVAKAVEQAAASELISRLRPARAAGSAATRRLLERRAEGVVIIAEMSPEQAERSNAIWAELVSRIDGPLPFVRVDPNDPQVIESLWHVSASGNEAEDAMRGVMYAQLLLHRAKNWRGGGDPAQAIAEICMAIAKKGNPSAVEFGFFCRASQLALAAALN
jgi:hypothetical protein